MRENHYAILVSFENFLRFQVQNKHNASYFTKMSWNGRAISNAKLIKKYETLRF